MAVTAPTLRASASGRWINCPEAPWLEMNYPDETGDAAREGTAAHEMAECVLNRVVSSPEELIDRQAKNGVMMTGEMVDPVQMYVDHVWSHGVGYWIEQSIIIENPSVMMAPVTGTCDGAAFGFDDATGTLYIDDFKYGYRQINPFENWQLLIYAIGIYHRINRNVKQVTMSIVQPRGIHHDGPVRSWTITVDELIHYTNILIERVNRVMSNDRMCHTGSWCRDCKAAVDCNAFTSAGMNAIDVIERALSDTKTSKQISTLLDDLKRASDTVNHLLDAVEARAVSMIATGHPIPGYGYQPGKGHRKFVDEQTAIAALGALGVNIVDDTVCSPSEAIRRVKKIGYSKKQADNIVNSLAFSPSTSPRLIKRDVSTLADKVFS